MGSTSTVSLILLDILRFSKALASGFWDILLLSERINSLVLNFFFILDIGESTGPRICKLFNC